MVNQLYLLVVVCSLASRILASPETQCKSGTWANGSFKVTCIDIGYTFQPNDGVCLLEARCEKSGGGLVAASTCAVWSGSGFSKIDGINQKGTIIDCSSPYSSVGSCKLDCSPPPAPPPPAPTQPPAPPLAAPTPPPVPTPPPTAPTPSTSQWSSWTNGYSYAVPSLQTSSPVQAKLACASVGASLAFVRDIEELSWLTTKFKFNFLLAPVHYWVDGTQTQGGEWKWGTDQQCVRDDLWDTTSTSTPSTTTSCAVLTTTGLKAVQCASPSNLLILCKKPTAPSTALLPALPTAPPTTPLPTPPTASPTAPAGPSAPAGAVAPVAVGGIKECKLEKVVNGFIAHRESNGCAWPYIGNYNSKIQIECNPGFTLVDPKHADLTCGDTSSLNWSPAGIPECTTPGSHRAPPLHRVLPQGAQDAITTVGSVLGGLSGAPAVTPALYDMQMLSSCSSDGEGAKSKREHATSKLLLPVNFLVGIENVYTGSMISLVIVGGALVLLHVGGCVIVWKIKKLSFTVVKQTIKLPSVETALWDVLAAPISLCCWGMLVSHDVSTIERVVGGLVLCVIFSVGISFSIITTHNILTGKLVVSPFDTTPQGFTPSSDELEEAPKLNPPWLFPSQYWHGDPEYDDRFHKQHGYQVTGYRPEWFAWLYTPLCTLIISFTTLFIVMEDHVGCHHALAVQMAGTLMRTVILLVWRPYLCGAQNVLAVIISLCASVTAILNFIPSTPPVIVLVSFLVTVLCIIVSLVYTLYSFVCRVKRINWMQQYDANHDNSELEGFTWSDPPSTMMTDGHTESHLSDA